MIVASMILSACGGAPCWPSKIRWFIGLGTVPTCSGHGSEEVVKNWHPKPMSN
jgi:hypothetical protein